MQVLEKNIKGFTILELLVVLAIVGVISAVAYPNFSSWNKEREVRSAVTKISSLIRNIHAQTEKGTFAYVQVKFTNTDKSLTVETKGMTMDTLATKMNDGDDPWNQKFPDNVTQRCSFEDSYWDTDTADAGASIKNFVSKVNFSSVTTSFAGRGGDDLELGEGEAVPVDMLGGAGDSEGVGAVCFSRGGKFYEANGDLLSDSDLPFGFIYICRRINDGETCPVIYNQASLNEEQVPATGGEYINAIKWSRFGNFYRTKWSGTGWIE